MTVGTRRAPRRELRLRSLDQVREELARIEAGGAAGSLITTGNWTPGEKVAHVGHIDEGRLGLLTRVRVTHLLAARTDTR